MSSNQQKLTAWFAKLDRKMNVDVPRVISEQANKYYRESFSTKSFAGVPWKPAKRPKKGGSLMVNTGALMNSIRTAIERKDLVRIKAGSSEVKYARIQNQGGVITKTSRSETFVRNRYKNGVKGKYFGGMGAFKTGTTPGRGLTFKAHTITIPKRQYMGHSAELNKRIIKAVKASFNSR